MAASVGSTPEVDKILATLDQNGDALRGNKPYARMNLIDAARSLIAELETPIESITRITWAEVDLGP